MASSYASSVISLEIPDMDSRVQEYNDLSNKVGRIHSSYLFYRENISKNLVPQLCQKTFVNLVKKIGGTKQSLSTSGWKDFGYYLGLSSEEINYIDNSMKICPTEAVLRVFSQRDDSTFRQIINSLLQMERLDVIEGIFDYLKELSSLLEDIKSDQGYHSNSEQIETIIKPNFFGNSLPEALRWKKDLESDPNVVFLPNGTLKIDQPSILLTYFDDGIEAAENICDILRNQKITNTKINVICLENEKMDVLTNPEQYIRNFFDEVQYVVPIITEGYLEAIKSPIALFSSSTNNIDCTYARFIYTLMSSHYINGTGCINRKIRSIIPQSTNNRKVLGELYKYPHLQVWMSEIEIDKFLTTYF